MQYRSQTKQRTQTYYNSFYINKYRRICHMSEFAFFRFVSYNMLTKEEKEHKNEIIELTEQVLDAKGIECDSRIAKISEEQLKEILEEVRQRRKKKRSNSLESDQNIEEGTLVQ